MMASVELFWTADKAIECMDNIKELNELEEQLKAEEQESEDED